MSRLSRRHLLASIGGAAGLLPLLGETRAHAAPPPLRLIVVAWPNGVYGPSFWPAKDGRLVIDPASSLAPFAPFVKKTLLVGGLELRNQRDSGSNNGHQAAPFLLTGVPGAPFEGTWDGVTKTGGGPSIDQHIANGLRAAGVATRLPSLVLRQDFYKGNDGYISIAGPPVANKVNAVTPEHDPKKIFDRLFADGTADGDAARRAGVRKSVLDHVAHGLERLTSGLGAEDRAKLGAHLQGVRDLERELSAAAPAACAAPAAPRAEDYTAKDGQTSAALGLQAGLVAAALACDLTRVVTLSWNATTRFSFALDDKGQPREALPDDKRTGAADLMEEHGLAHKQWESAPDGARRALVDRWYFARIADLLARLDAVKEGDGTLLDHSVVVVTSQMGDGAWHSIDDIPWILVGGANGFFRTEQVIRRPSGAAKTSVPQTRLLLALCAAFGVSAKGFADPAYGDELPGLRA